METDHGQDWAEADGHEPQPDEAGQTVVEYALILALVGIVFAVALAAISEGFAALVHHIVTLL